MQIDHVRLFQTLPHACGYYAGRTAQNLVIDPAAPQLAHIYDHVLERGFRRAGGHLYAPACPHCHACIPCRIDVARFKPDRSQRRCLQRNADLEVIETEPRYSEERHALYRQYLQQRHAGGGMDEGDASDFQRFLTAPWSPTVFLELRRQQQLLGIAVTDLGADGVSAVYTFFDPAETARSLGTFAILQQIQLAARHGLPWLYLGFWINGHPKMDYKRRFQPLQVRLNGQWREAMPLADSSRAK